MVADSNLTWRLRSAPRAPGLASHGVPPYATFVLMGTALAYGLFVTVRPGACGGADPPTEATPYSGLMGEFHDPYASFHWGIPLFPQFKIVADA